MKLNWAERWAVNNPLRVLQQRLEVDWMKRRAGQLNGAVALEVGCGRGAGAKLIIEAFEPAVLHVSDLDMGMIRKSRRRLAHEHLERAFLHVTDVFRLPYRGETLDAVFGFGVLHHVPDWRGALAEISRVLKKEGKYFIEEIYPPVYQNWLAARILLHPREDRFQSHDLRKALSASKLTTRDILEIPKVGLLAVSVKTGE
jgi:ubiquinone/menaquinone biosynthesis C-methylase UbiE